MRSYAGRQLTPIVRTGAQFREYSTFASGVIFGR